LPRLLVLALFITFDLVMFGAFVRVADAGLGCPDWPGCYGKVTPLGAIQEISAEALERPHGPVTVFKAWVEMLHRYIAGALGVLIICLAWLAWRHGGQRHQSAHAGADRRPASEAAGPAAVHAVAGPSVGPSVRPSVRPFASPFASPPAGPSAGSPTGRFAGPPAGPSAGLACFTLFWVILQGMFGMWTVTLRLQPAVVTAHLLGGIILFALLLMQHNRISHHPPVSAAALRYRSWGLLAMLLVFVQIALGGWVSSNYATLACRDFPMCQGSWWPSMDIAAGFEVWRPLGMTGEGAGLPFPALTAIHYAHRLIAYVVLVAVGVLAWRVRRVAGLEGVGRWLLLVLLAQFITGLTNIFLDWPMAAAVLHTGGATALVGGLLMLNFRVGMVSRATSEATMPVPVFPVPR
jgi:cytochrome c oxidase assembly protein subunit 15